MEDMFCSDFSYLSIGFLPKPGLPVATVNLFNLTKLRNKHLQPTFHDIFAKPHMFQWVKYPFRIVNVFSIGQLWPNCGEKPGDCPQLGFNL
jgi:hypothetical protein